VKNIWRMPEKKFAAVSWVDRGEVEITSNGEIPRYFEKTAMSNAGTPEYEDQAPLL
jgi:hypothetical protein